MSIACKKNVNRIRFHFYRLYFVLFVQFQTLFFDQHL
jgi:hypothetical protein